MIRLAGIVVLTIVTLASSASGRELEKISSRAQVLAKEISNISAAVRAPNNIAGRRAPQAVRVVDAKVKYELGDYDSAALILYNYVESPSARRDRNYYEAMYYLALSLEKKADMMGAYGYLEKLAAAGAATGYQKRVLEKLIELAPSVNKPAEPWVNTLKGIASAGDLSADYILGKHAVLSSDWANAEQRLRRIKPRAKEWFRAQYLLGTTLIETQRLTEAVAQFEKILRAKAKTKDDKRVLELSTMALGRLHHAQNRPGEAISAYVQIDRKSDLFDEALYEVAWVYVKSKQFEKALRALELLALTDAKAKSTPEVKMLEANLRIRRAQNLSRETKGNPTEELEKALAIFKEVKNKYERPYEELNRIVIENQDPKLYVAQLTDRDINSKETRRMPEMAAEWIRRRKELRRILRVEGDLSDIRNTLVDTQELIERLEGVMASPSRVSAFPALADKRQRSSVVRAELTNMRNKLLEEHKKLVDKRLTGQQRDALKVLEAERVRILGELGAAATSSKNAIAAASKANGRLEKLERLGAEIGIMLESNRASLSAIEIYIDKHSTHLNESQKRDLRLDVERGRKDVEALEKELAVLEKEIVIARDQVGYGDPMTQAIKARRTRLSQLYAQEHQILASAGGSNRYLAVEQRIASTDDNIVTLQNKIDSIVTDGLVGIVDMLKREKSSIEEYKDEYLGLDQESRSVGAKLLKESFKGVRNDLRDVVIEADVGVIDVTWARKEATDEEFKRLRMERERQMRTLVQDFESVLAGGN